jgi:hypothetical protein
MIQEDEPGEALGFEIDQVAAGKDRCPPELGQPEGREPRERRVEE